jgi:hypothetical protein
LKGAEKDWWREAPEEFPPPNTGEGFRVGGWVACLPARALIAMASMPEY